MLWHVRCPILCAFAFSQRVGLSFASQDDVRRRALLEHRAELPRGSSFEEVAYINPSFAENRAQRAFRHVSGMVRKRDFCSRFRIEARDRRDVFRNNSER